MRSERSLDPVAEAVADGVDVDWDRAEAGAESVHDRLVVQQLRHVADVARAARTLFRSWGALDLRSEIASGTYGTVYRAWYQHLECEVALKLLHDSHHSRIREACLLAQVRHPNVVAVYGADTIDGRTGIWMELVSGQTLKSLLEQHGPFSPDEAALIGRDLCRALAAVHQKGFVHGDIKAQNVMRGAGGRTVLMDFGAGDGISDEAVQRGPVVASPAYVAPEVLAGSPPTVRGDLYSLGVLLYYLVTGRFPVVADSLSALREAHAQGQRHLLRDARPDLPAGFVQVIDRATASDPAARPESAGTMERLLEAALGVSRPEARPAPPPGESAPARPSKPSYAWLVSPGALVIAAGIAVTTAVAGWVTYSHATRAVPVVHAITVAPLEVRQGGPTWKTIAETMTADVARDLERPGLVVKGRAQPIGSGGNDIVAQALNFGADAVVQGSLVSAGDRLSLDIAVVDTKSRRTVWRQQYTTAASEAESLTHRVSADIANAFGFGAARALREGLGPVSLDAYDHYARGRQLAEQREPSALLRATQQFEEAIRIEPTYAAAWAGLADTWIALGVPAFGPLRPFEARGRAREAALKALDLDPNLAEAHVSLAFLSYFHDWNWSAADERFQRALRLNPNDAQAHHWYADYLNAMGRFDEATIHIQTACALEPLSLLYQRDVGWHLFFQRKYAEAIAQLRGVLAMDSTYAPAISLLGRALVQDGQFEAGIEELKKLDLNNPANVAMLAYAYASAGDRNQSAAWLARVSNAGTAQYVSPYSVALVEAAQGNNSRALAKLFTAFDEQDSTIVNLNVDARFDRLRNDARFVELIRRMRFPNPGFPR